MISNLYRAGLEGQKLSEPDVTVLDWILMPLEADRCLFWVGLWVFSNALPDGGSIEILVVVDNNTIVDDGDECWAHQFSVGIFRGSEEDVIALPFSLWGRCIHLGWSLAVEGASLSISIGDIGVAFLDLYLVFIHKENAAIATFLILDLTASRNSPLDMELAVAKAFFGVVVAW